MDNGQLSGIESSYRLSRWQPRRAIRQDARYPGGIKQEFGRTRSAPSGKDGFKRQFAFFDEITLGELMKKYQTMSDQLVACWVDEDVHEKPGAIDFHYHNVEEWLKILKGEMTFFSVGNRQRYALGEAQALHIPQGEVHRVEIGSSGVTYRMWTPVELPKPFRVDLDQDVLQLIERNLKVPEQENQWDRRDPNTPKEELQQKDEYKFLSGFVSEGLIFHTAAGSVLRTKEEYLSRSPSPAVWRFSSGSVRILDLRRDGKSDSVTSLLLSTVVHTREKADPRKSVVNLRSFVKESGGWVCRLWLNYLEPQPEDRP